MDFNIGDVWMAFFPYEETPELAKMRPVVVLGDFAVEILSVKVTTHDPREEDKYDYSIVYWKEAGLNYASTARISKTVLLSKDRFKKKIGNLKEYDLENVIDRYVEYQNETTTSI